MTAAKTPASTASAMSKLLLDAIKLLNISTSRFHRFMLKRIIETGKICKELIALKIESGFGLPERCAAR
jgi:hypothetical protein